ncbi:MAG: hypothetical protein FWC89_03310 [Defluviitaleaceae bacterium]|nr:hypothetical protein [Defluviitaleaceae bacterium]
MASTMIHLYLANKINPDGCGLYFMGSFAPDTFDNNRSDVRMAKIKNHFRDTPSGNAEEAEIIKFYSQIDKDNPFHVGYFVHLLCDLWWHIAIDKIAGDSGDRQGWYANLKNEYRVSGIWIRRNMPWVDDVFRKMESCMNDFQSPTPDPTSEEIINYTKGLVSPSLRESDKNSDGKPSTILTPAFLESYSNEIAKRYMLWVGNK